MVCSVGCFEGCAVAVAAVVAVVAVAVAVAVELAAGLLEALDDPVDGASVDAFVDRFGDCAVAGSTGSWRGAGGADAALLVAAVSWRENLDVYLQDTFSFLIEKTRKKKKLFSLILSNFFRLKVKSFLPPYW